MDAATLNRLLAAVAVNRVEVPLGPQRTVTVELHDLRVTGFEPPGASGGKGTILAAVRVVAPELGLQVPLEPRIVVDVANEAGASTRVTAAITRVHAAIRWRMCQSGACVRASSLRDVGFRCVRRD